jgi:cysteine desulfurase family protein (TIGR01976 family)
MSVSDFPVGTLRLKFPALRSAGRGVFFDNAAGAQVPDGVIEAIRRHLIENNVQRGGRYPRSLAVDAAIARGRSHVAALVNARRPEEIALGMNATSFIRTVSLAIGQLLAERDEIIVTDLDHEANVATWLALEPMGAKVRWWHMRPDGCLHPEDLRKLLGPRTRLVACTLASNALGSVLDVRAAADLAHAAGAEIFIDAVHYGPHGVIDAQAFDCDYLVCSGYKIFAPHMGFLWGRYEALVRLPTFREDFIPDEPPGKLEAGTFIYENVAGMTAAIDYLAEVGRAVTGRSGPAGEGSLRQDCCAGMSAIREYEQKLSCELLRVLRDCGAEVYGLQEQEQVGARVPTFCFNLPGHSPAAVTEAAAAAGIGVRDGHMYAPRLMRRLGLAPQSGAVRVSLVHYNTAEEVRQLGEVLARLRRPVTSVRAG